LNEKWCKTPNLQGKKIRKNVKPIVGISPIRERKGVNEIMLGG